MRRFARTHSELATSPGVVRCQCVRCGAHVLRFGASELVYSGWCSTCGCRELEPVNSPSPVGLAGAHRAPLEADELQRTIACVPVFDFFDRSRTANARMEAFRVHALATQHAAGRIQRETGTGDADLVLVAALLHDLGKLVLADVDERWDKV